MTAYTARSARRDVLLEEGVDPDDALPILARIEFEIEQTLPAGVRAQFRSDLASISDDKAVAGAARFGRQGLTDSTLQDIAGACVGLNSFSANTLVALSDGTLLPIAEVRVGDQVLAYDFDAGTTVARSVTATLPHTDWLLEAHFSDGTVMEVTEDHRFW